VTSFLFALTLSQPFRSQRRWTQSKKVFTGLTRDIWWQPTSSYGASIGRV